MREAPAPPSAYSPRTLDLLATLLSGRAARVVLTSRTGSPVVVAWRAATLFLDPDRCGLYDLVLASFLVRFHERADAVRAAHAAVRQRMPGALRLEGCTHPGQQRPVEPILVERDVTFSPLTPGAASSGAFEAIDRIGIHGVDDDLEAFVAAIAAGDLPVESHPTLPGWKVARTTLNLRMPPINPAEDEALALRMRAVRSGARDAARCVQKKSEGDRVALTGVRPRSYGTRIDGSRLHEAAVARRTRRPARLFRRQRERTDAVFRSDQHFAAIGFDLGSFESSARGRPSGSVSAVLFFVEVYRYLDVPFEVTAYGGRAVDLPDGSRLYLHVEVPIVAADAPFDSVARARLHAATKGGLSGPGTSACAHALQIDALNDRALTATEDTTRLRSIHWCYLGVHDVRPCAPTDALLRRTADAIDASIDRLRVARNVPVVTTGIVPRALQRATSRRSFVSEMLGQ